MANGGEFQEKIQQLGKLIAQFDQMPDGPQKNGCKELVQLLMDVHGAGLERVLEIVFENEASGAAIIDKLGQDSIAGSLLLLYSLHPDDLETRLRRAMERMRPRLRKLACIAELVRVVEGVVQVRVTTGHSCGSSTKDVKAIVEEGVYEFAPDVTSLEIVGLVEPSPSGFVALESLVPHSLVGVTANGHASHLESAE